MSELRAALRRHWRVRPATFSPRELAERLEIHPLEERRVLSAAAALAMAQALAADGMEQVEGATKNPDPATPLGTDAAHQEPIDPGDRTVQGEPAHSENDDTKGPAAENLTESENRTAASPGDVEANVAASVEEEVGLSLIVVGDQTVNEGTELAIPDLGQFTDYEAPSEVEYTYTIDWGDGTAATVGVATIDQLGGDGLPTLGSFDGSHTYADNGTYVVQVTLTDGENFAGGQFTVRVTNVAPTLTVVPDQVATEGQLLSITNLGQFSDPGFDNPLNVTGEVKEQFTYAIDWGDGTPLDFGPPTIDVVGGEGVPTQGSFDGSHIYADNGVYTVTVTISDDDGGSDVQTFMVRVSNVAPDLTVVPNQTVDEGALLSIPNIGTFTDPGFDNPLNVGGETKEQFTYVIDWGDGTPIDFGPPTIDVPGGPGVPTQGSFDGSHVYADNGIYTVTVTISDDDGGSAVQTFMVTVRNVAPMLTVPADQIVDEGSLLSITNIGQFTDPGFNNPLNVGGETQEQFTYVIDWGDGTPVDFGPATIDVPGGPGVPTQGSFDGSHIYADNGVYTVTVTISDDDGGSDVQTFMVTVRNVAPDLTVVPDQIVNEGALLSIPNIGTFTDPGFDNPLNVGGETKEQFTYAIDWGDGTPLDFGPATIDVPGGPGVPTQGSFDGSHIYADNGVYTVTVTISDDDGGSDVQTFTVMVRNVAPDLIVAPDQMTDEGALLVIVNIGQFTDPGFDNPLNEGGETQELFTYTIDWGDGTPLDFGPPTIDVPGGPGVPTQGSFDGSHTYADNGLYTVTITISDDDGGTTIATLNVLVRNVDPTLTVPGDRMADEGVGFTITNIGQFTDPGFDNPLNVGGETVERFTYAIDWGDGSPLDFGPVTDFTTGGVGFPSEGRFDGGHTYLAAGTYTVKVTVSDDDGGMAMGTFQVTVKAGSLIVITAPNQTVNEGSLLSVNPIAQFIDPRPGGAESYTYTIQWGDGRPSDSGPAMIGGGGEGSISGSFPGAHVYADNGLYTVVVTVTSSDGRTGQASLQVAVANVAPTITSVTPNLTVPLGNTLLIPNLVRFTDPGFDNPLNVGGETVERFTYTIAWGDGTPNTSGPADILAPGGISVLTMGGLGSQHIFAFPATFTVTVTVFDDDGGSAAATFQVEVFVLREPPLFTPPGGGGGTNPPPPTPPPAIDARAQAPFQVNRFELRRARSASVAGEELRLVLRIVRPDGEEDPSSDEILRDEVLDRLRDLFQRLPDGHYRIYQIQPDETERLVVDVILHQGRSITLFDESQAVREEANTNPPAQGEAIDEALPPPPAAPAEPALDKVEARDQVDLPDGGLQGAASVLSGGVGLSLAARRTRALREPSQREPRSLKKVHRILRRGR